MKDNESEINGPDDGKCFEKIFKSMYPAILRFARFYVSDFFDAEFIASNAFIKLSEKGLNKFVSKQKIRAFLLNCVKNECLGLLAHAKRRMVIYVDNKHLINEYLGYFSNKNGIEKGKILLLQEQIDSLPLRLKEVLKLHCEGFSVEEIADRSGIKIKTVQDYISLAIKTIKKNLGK